MQGYCFHPCLWILTTSGWPLWDPGQDRPSAIQKGSYVLIKKLLQWPSVLNFKDACTAKDETTAGIRNKEILTAWDEFSTLLPLGL